MVVTDAGGHERDTNPWMIDKQLTVLHLDKDFEVIAEITGQPVERLVVSST